MVENRKKNSFSTYLLCLIFMLLVAAAIVLLLPVMRELQKKQGELTELNAELNEKREESVRLNTEVADLKQSPAAVEKVAREKFGLVREGERVMKYPAPEKSK